jgi:hypothetical protein
LFKIEVMNSLYRIPYFTFSIGNKHGVIDRNGQVIVPPQYINIRHAKNSDFFYLFRNQGFLITIQKEKYAVFNNLLIQKIKALKDINIDCRDPSLFLKTVENRFLLNKDGIDFHFNSQTHGKDLVIVSLTWAELEPFLKMRL